MAEIRSVDDSFMLVERVRNMSALAHSAKSASKYLDVGVQEAQLELVSSAAELDTVVMAVKNTKLKGILEQKVQQIMAKSI